MAFSSLSEAEKETVHQCLTAILNGRFIEDWEFSTRLGLDRDALRRILGSWPQLDDTAEGPVRLAINNCMNEVCHGVNISPAEWDTWFTVPYEDVKVTYFKWAKLVGYSSSGIR